MCVWLPTWSGRERVKKLSSLCLVSMSKNKRIKNSSFSQGLLCRPSNARYNQCNIFCPLSERPVFVQRPVNQVVLVDESVEFRCQVHGDPKPTLRWKKDDVDLSRSRWAYSLRGLLRNGNPRLCWAHKPRSSCCNSDVPRGRERQAPAVNWRDVFKNKIHPGIKCGSLGLPIFAT